MSIQSPTSPLRVAFIFCLAALATPSHAQEKAGIGYGGAYVQLKPIMAPVRGPHNARLNREEPRPLGEESFRGRNRSDCKRILFRSYNRGSG